MGRHGGGSRSGGGGGGFHGGGGHSFGHHHSSFGHHHHHYGGGGVSFVWIGGHVRSRPRCCFGGCMCLLLIVFIIIVAAVAPKTGNTNTKLAGWESIALSVSTTWYSGITLSTPQPDTVSFYLVPQKQYGSVHPFQDKAALSVSSQNYEYWAYHLLPGSSISISWNTSQSVAFYLVIGDSDFSKWESGSNSGTQLTYSNKYTYSYTVTSENTYYFVWENTGYGSTANGFFNANIQAVQYDVSQAKSSCVNITFCHFDFVFGSSETVIVNTIAGALPDSSFTYDYTVNARTSFYWALFGGLIAGLAVIIALILACLAIRYRRGLNSANPYAEISQPVPPYNPQYVAGSPSAPPY